MQIFFLSNLVTQLVKDIKINNHTIEWIDDQQSPYKSIYYVKLIKFEILKTYIKTNLVNSLIMSSKFSAKTFIFFEKKANKSL